MPGVGGILGINGRENAVEPVEVAEVRRRHVEGVNGELLSFGNKE